MGQYCLARWRLSSVVVCNAPAGWRVGQQVWAVGGHCMAGQYGYVPLGRYLVSIRNAKNCDLLITADQVVFA